MSGSTPSPSTSSPAPTYADAPVATKSKPIKAESVLSRLPAPFARSLQRLIELLKIPPPSTPEILQRIETMERVIVLPIKVAAIAMLLQ